MNTFRHLRIALAAAAGITALGTAGAFDSLGGFDQAYTNGGNMFGHGAWGDGRGTAIPLPNPQPEYGFYFGRPYDGGNNLFGTGFWTAEYMVRHSESLSRHSDAGDAPWEGGPLGDGHAGDGGYDYDDGDWHGDDGKKAKGDHGKGGHGKDGHKGKGGHDKGGHEKGHKKMPPKKMHKEKERVRYIPYAREQVVVVPRRSSYVTIIERREHTVELGRVEIREERRTENFTAVCLNGKGDEVEAILVTERGGDESYEGEIFRCPGDAMLRVSYATGAADIVGSVRVDDGTSYKDCDGGDALVRTSSGELMCERARAMSASAERNLARAHGAAEAHVASGGGYDDDGYDAGGEQVDLSGLELTGGVGNFSGY